MRCPACGDDALLASVVMTYDVPLSARDGGIKVGGLKISKFDVRDAWQRLQERPIWCTACHNTYVWNVATQLLEAKEW